MVGDAETWRRMYPVAGSRQTACAAARTGPRCGVSACASRADSVSPNAADNRPSRAAVGLASARSILLIIALETPERAARASSDQRREARSSRVRAAMVESMESMIVDTSLL